MQITDTGKTLPMSIGMKKVLYYHSGSFATKKQKR